MTWMIPLLVITSAVVTVAPFTMTVSLTEKVRLWSLTVVAVMQLDTLAAGTAPAITWDSRMSVSCALPSTVSRAVRSMPASMKAWSVGAKRVKGPLPCSVSSRSAWTTALTRVS